MNLECTSCSKTVCRDRELKYVCAPRDDDPPPCAKLPLIPKIRAGVGYAPPPIRLHPLAYERQNQRIAERGIELLKLGPLRASQYELVRPLPSSVKFILKALFYHANFEAKSVYDPQAPTELFFLELVLGSGGMVKPILAHIIRSLGPSDSMTDDDDWRCSMCKKEIALHEKDTQPRGTGKKICHPKNVKFNYDLYAIEKV